MRAPPWRGQPAGGPGGPGQLQLGQFIGRLGACRLDQELRKEQNRADPAVHPTDLSGGGEQAAYPTAKRVAIDGGVDQDIGVEGVHQPDGGLSSRA